MDKRKALLEFKNHHYIHEYVKTGYYCPKCGVKDVWVEDNSGDYYVGPGYYCVSCDSRFTMPDEPGPRNDEWGEISRQLRAGICDEPTTPKGH